MNDLALQLQRPFRREDVEWRIDGKPWKWDNGLRQRMVCYMTKSLVHDRFDEVFGPLGWYDQYRSDVHQGGVICRIGCRVADMGATFPPSTWPYKEDGARQKPAGDDDKVGDPVKTVLSHALKRAAMAWGVGRYLNHVRNVSVFLRNGKNYDIDFRLNLKHDGKDYHVIPDPSVLPGPKDKLRTWDDYAVRDTHVER